VPVRRVALQALHLRATARARRRRRPLGAALRRGRGGACARRCPAAAALRLCCSHLSPRVPNRRVTRTALDSALSHQLAFTFNSGSFQAPAGSPGVCIRAAHRLPGMRHTQRGAHHGAFQRPVGRGAARAHPGVLQCLRGRQAPVHVPVQQALRALQPSSLSPPHHHPLIVAPKRGAETADQGPCPRRRTQAGQHAACAAPAQRRAGRAAPPARRSQGLHCRSKGAPGAARRARGRTPRAPRVRRGARARLQQAARAVGHLLAHARRVQVDRLGKHGLPHLRRACAQGLDARSAALSRQRARPARRARPRTQRGEARRRAAPQRSARTAAVRRPCAHSSLAATAGPGTARVAYKPRWHLIGSVQAPRTRAAP